MGQQTECTCHLCPPCAFCVSLTEEEVEIMAEGGVEAVLRHRAAITPQEEWDE